ncbi:MAG: 3-hydroxyacyl-CoA dehydrogenase NAD-binding domain-containing protein [Planctomycetota bacterium]|jgi:3-hydroxyacyl-CoA dehydrogenase/enoyl-CoA hydratase/3-hydroxybutyryl-CoA epimerase
MSTVTKNKTTKKAPEEGVVHLGERRDGIAVLHLGASSEKIVTITERRIDSLKEVLLRLKEDKQLRGLIVTGPRPSMFAAGADISVIESIEDPSEGERTATKGRSVYGLFQELSVPVVGAIEGPCLGGGLEMTLCFDVRVVSNDPSTTLGLPEVMLGIVPGFGGTQRLPRLLGLPKALDLILTGKTLKAKKAFRTGLADRIVPSAKLMDAAWEEVLKLVNQRRKAPKRKLRGMAFWMSRVGFLRSMIRRQVGKKLSSGQARFYEAPPIALELCLNAFALPAKVGFEKEAQALGRLIVSPTCKGLVRLYFLTERSKRLGKSPDARKVGSALVIGGGVMGAGIAGQMAGRGMRVRLCDLADEVLTAAKARLQKGLSKRLRRRKIERHEAVATQDRLAVSQEWGNLGHTDMVLEAVVENLELKQKLFRQAVDNDLSDEAIVATNTSSLPVDQMAEGLPNPERVVGMHFFNPPEKMPLVEIIRGPRTSDATAATVCKLAARLGKYPVVVKDSPGFLVNRCLAPYLNEAAQLMLEGCEPEFVDKVMLDFGLPMGPARLMDTVGFDVAAKVSEVMSAAFADRMQPCPLFGAMVKERLLGQKTGGGLYDKSAQRPGPGRKVLQQLRSQSESKEANRSQVVERLIYPMVNEAYRCLQEGLVESEDDVDLGLVMGIGFPPFTGGICAYARREGLKHIVQTLDRMGEELDPRFKPSKGLRERAVQEDRVD